MKEQKEVMILDDEPIVGERLKPVLEKEGFSVETFTESTKALERLKEKKFHVLVTDLKMSGPDGIDVLASVKSSDPDTQVIMITGYATVEAAREAEYVGAFAFLTKPFKMDELKKLVIKAAKKGK